MPENLRIDHVMRVVADLEDAAAGLLQTHGIASVDGGRHDGRGTGNRIVPLGSGYIELLTVVDHAEASQNPSGRAFAAAIAEGDRWFNWCVASSDLEATATRLGLQISDWSRTRPDGTQLRWRLAGTEQSALEPSLPFFIQWDIPPELHPASSAAEHRVEVSGLGRVHVSGDLERLDRWLDGAAIPVDIVRGDPAVRAVEVEAGTGTVVLT